MKEFLKNFWKGAKALISEVIGPSLVAAVAIVIIIVLKKIGVFELTKKILTYINSNDWALYSCCGLIALFFLIVSILAIHNHGKMIRKREKLDSQGYHED